MSQKQPGHLPPEALEDWMAKVSDLLGFEEDIDISAVLDLTRDVAHDVARPAAPLTTFALGLALGRKSPEEFETGFRDYHEQLTRLAEEQDSP
ncbi:MAG: hypothetical protein QG596_403 [Actinomycetota bacterium]|jgi:hypothetical protein|nr:hypothetical protein [Actinomycetota bacterium]